MNASLAIVLLILAACVGMFVAGRPRMDVVALVAIVLLTVTGVLTLPEALAGFSDPNVILIAALFVVGEGLVGTGVAHRIGTWLVAKSGASETKLLVLLMLAVAGLGSVMSSTGVVAIFIPVVLGIARHMRMQPARLMMPLSFAGLISGMMTLVATPPNMIVDSALKQAGHEGLSFFSVTPIGAVVLALGVGYMLFARRLLAVRVDDQAPRNAAPTLADLIRAYGLASHEWRVRIMPGSPLAGHTLKQLALRNRYKANVIAIERPGRFQPYLVQPSHDTELRVGDVLFLDTYVPLPNVLVNPSADGLELLPLTGNYFTDQAGEIGIAEIMLPPGSSLLGKTVLDLGFRRKYGLNVVGLRRGASALPVPVTEEKLKVGDTLLVIGPWKAIHKLRPESRDFVLLGLPAESAQAIPRRRRAPYALASLMVMVVLMVTGIVPNAIAGLIACLLLGATRCIDRSDSYRSIRWDTLVLIVGMIPFALALEKTGGVELAATGLLQFVGESHPYLVLGSLFVLTAGIGLFISNTATAVLMAPIALNIATQLGASPLPFTVIVALAASASFMTPVSSPVNTLVMVPGNYRFGDFVRIGVPFTVLVLIVSVLMVPLLFPL